LLVVGAGNMGGALLKGWLAQGLDPGHVRMVDPAPSPAMLQFLVERSIALTAEPIKLSSPPQVVVLAVKPQIMENVLPAVASLVGANTVVISVAAGRTIKSLSRALPRSTALVRTIPNTPASIGRGITVAVANAFVTSVQKSLCDGLLQSVGEVAWVDDEHLIDAATAVSGSGPAYVFLLAECLAEAGRAVGLPAELAARLARATVSGAGEFLHRSDQAPSVLRQNVTSPKGTTAAALEVLMAPGAFRELMTRAVAAAEKRARELAN
jgi:pyrroline-5-carboxylate reductase